MFESKANILKNIDMDFLVHFSFATKLLNPSLYFTKQDFINGLSRRLNVEQCKLFFGFYKKGFKVDTIANKFLLELNSNATTIKKLFVSYLFYKEIKKISNDVVFFEFNVGKSRTDVNRINGYSYAFEIKSGRDKLERAYLQTKIFSDVFDFVILIVNNDEPHEAVSENVGIIRYEYIDGEMTFNMIRKPKRNLELDIYKQLNSLSKRDLFKILNTKKIDKIDKLDLVKETIKSFSEREINSVFKTTLKQKYFDRWKSYIQRHVIQI